MGAAVGNGGRGTQAQAIWVKMGNPSGGRRRRSAWSSQNSGEGGILGWSANGVSLALRLQHWALLNVGAALEVIGGGERWSACTRIGYLLAIMSATLLLYG